MATKRTVRLRDAIAALEAIAPLELAEEWDNVGLLLEPRAASRASVSKVLLTVDTTGAVLAEALRLRCDLVVSYHPPIFQPLRSLTQAVPRQRSLLDAIREGIAVWSPHTALDAAAGGVNDWLAEGLKGGGAPRACVPITENGQGRLLELGAAVAIPALLQRVKRHLSIASPRVARPGGRSRKIRRIALCAGAGGAVLEGVDADLYLTGEMRHHDVLAAVEAGIAVVLCGHTNTERGYLPVLRDRLRGALPGIQVAVSRADRDPLANG